jgi:hypothetical protein
MVMSATFSGFVSFYGILLFITASFDRFGSLGGPDHLFEPFSTVTRISLSILFVFL